MGIFDRLYYGKAGQRDYTEMDMPKNRVSLFFQVLKDHFFDLIKVNFLQLIFWIPFILWTYINLIAIQSIDTQAILGGEGGSQAFTSTVSGYVSMWLLGLVPCLAITGPSSAGAAYIMRNWARDQHAFLWSDYKDAFKGNWKQALATSVFTAFVPILAYTAVMFYSEASKMNMIMIAPMVVVLSAVFLWTIMLPLMYPMMVGYELKLKDMIKNAFIMATAGLPRMILARVITFIPVAAMLVGLFVGNGITILVVSLYYLLFGFAFSRLVYASVANGVFDKYLNPHIEGAVTRQGLRPQTDDELFDDDDEEDEDDAYAEDSDD